MEYLCKLFLCSIPGANIPSCAIRTQIAIRRTFLIFKLIRKSSSTENTALYIKRAGEGLDLEMGKIEFDIVFDREKCKLSDVFYGMKNIARSKSYSIFNL